MPKGYTLKGAYQLRMEDQIGSIQKGKVADFVILSDYIFDQDPYTIHKIKPEAVVMEGQIIQGNLD
jgi:predicted amidohydrolase YtcJ